MPLVRIRLVATRPRPYPEHPCTIGEHIKKRRIELGLSQRQAATYLSVNPWTVGNWEAGRYDPQIRAMPAILTFLGYDPFPEPVAVCDCLLQLRRECGWSIGAAASQLGVDPTTWRDWEAGHIILFRKHRIKVATLLGLDPRVLIDEMRARWNGKHRRSEFWER